MVKDDNFNIELKHFSPFLDKILMNMLDSEILKGSFSISNNRMKQILNVDKSFLVLKRYCSFLVFYTFL